MRLRDFYVRERHEKHRVFILRERQYLVKGLKANGCRRKRWYQQMLNELRLNAGRGFLMGRALQVHYSFPRRGVAKKCRDFLNEEVHERSYFV